MTWLRRTVSLNRWSRRTLLRQKLVRCRKNLHLKTLRHRSILHRYSSRESLCLSKHLKVSLRMSRRTSRRMNLKTSHSRLRVTSCQVLRRRVRIEPIRISTQQVHLRSRNAQELQSIRSLIWLHCRMWSFPWLIGTILISRWSGLRMSQRVLLRTILARLGTCYIIAPQSTNCMRNFRIFR